MRAWLRWPGLALCLLLAAAALGVVAVQSNPGRLVVLEPLRGSGPFSLAVTLLPLLLAGAVAFVARRGYRGWTVLAGAGLALLVGLVMLVAQPVTHTIDDRLDRDVAVVAVAPDGTFEVVLARVHGDSGDLLALRARSRAGLRSRSARYPLAWLCSGGDRLVVRFTGPTQLTVAAGDGFTGSLSVDRRTLEAGTPISNCGDPD